MNRKQYYSMVLFALTAGLIGGVVSSQFFIGRLVFAEKKPAHHQKVVKAEEFQLVDSEGSYFGSFGFETVEILDVPFDRVFLRLVSKDKRSVIELDLLGGKPNLTMFKDGRARVKLGLNQVGESVLSMKNKFGWDCAQLKAGPSEKVALLFFKPIAKDIDTGRVLSEQHGNLRTALGNIELIDVRTGGVKKRPISSLVLVGEDNKVIWQAP